MIDAISPAGESNGNQAATISYPILLLRIQALMLDTVVVILLLLAAVMTIIGFNIEHTPVKTALMVGPVLLFEPLMIRFTGGSVGHHYAGMRIVDGKTGEQLLLIKSIVRFVLKCVLGILSFVTMLVTQRRQAIHDFLSGSVVVFKDETKVSPNFKLKHRQLRADGGQVPLWRRLAVVLVYWVFIFLAISGAAAAMISDSCVFHDVCTNADNVRAYRLSVGLVIGFVLIFIAGVAGHLPGAGKRR